MQPSLFSSVSWSVTDLTRYLRQVIESDGMLQDVGVQGEISNLSRPSSGHIYFTLKDGSASLRCVMWKGDALRLRLPLRDGDSVQAHGRIGVYEVGGQYQLYADRIQPVGEGALYQEFLRLKAALEAEGLFDPARKRELPALPKRIGIVTSPTGAALRDMLNTLRRRLPLVEVVLAPTPVQGEDAPPAIVAAVEALNHRTRPDVILLARGGGSIEDLWAFNDERVVRAVAASEAPVVTGVGHETDFTLADFVADLRAPTPTAAAELVTPVTVADLLAVARTLERRLADSLRERVRAYRGTVQALASRLGSVSPARRILNDRQRLDDQSRQMTLALSNRMRLDHARLQGLERRLAALSPLAVLARGYAMVQGADGKVVRSTRQVKPGEPLQVRVADGTFGARVEPG
jgi:exodeoxyribonuclease VII large subunit